MVKQILYEGVHEIDFGDVVSIDMLLLQAETNQVAM
jgi:hypothetical protein